MQEMLSMEAIINPIMDGVNLQNMLFFENMFENQECSCWINPQRDNVNMTPNSTALVMKYSAFAYYSYT